MQYSKHTLKLNNLQLIATLGVFEFEKEYKQKVKVDIELELLEPPNACNSDEHHDSICYANLSELLQKECDIKSFNMIEFMASFLLKIIQKNINIPANITLDITKKIPDSQLETATYRIYEKWKKEA